MVRERQSDLVEEEKNRLQMMKRIGRLDISPGLLHSEQLPISKEKEKVGRTSTHLLATTVVLLHNVRKRQREGSCMDPSRKDWFTHNTPQMFLIPK